MFLRLPGSDVLLNLDHVIEITAYADGSGVWLNMGDDGRKIHGESRELLDAFVTMLSARTLEAYGVEGTADGTGSGPDDGVREGRGDRSAGHGEQPNPRGRSGRGRRVAEAG